MTIKELEKKHTTFIYFPISDGWVFKTGYFTATFELKDETDIQELCADENFVNWLDEQFSIQESRTDDAKKSAS